MIYLEAFRMPSREAEEDFFSNIADPRNRRTCYTTKYPFHVFRYRQLPEFSFAPVTIFYGGNGSGKSTILNVMAEVLHLRRGAVYNRSDFFEDYTALCRCRHRAIPRESRIITSDDVFDHLLDVRCINEGIDTARVRLLDQYVTDRHERYPLKSLDDYETWRRHADAQSMSQSRFLREHLMENVEERSNGESALAYFTECIRENALYLLDEPENSLSAALQLKLKGFLEDSVRFFGCQLVISTHSPFLLSMPGAKIYDLDQAPPCARPWTELENVRVYRDFFREHDGEFS